MILGCTNIGHIQRATNLSAALGLGLLFAGIAIRWAAIYTLGEYFTGTVLIRNDHQPIRNGLYKHLRHPAYTGALIAHLGLGLSFSNWITLGLSLVPFTELPCTVCMLRSEPSARHSVSRTLATQEEQNG